MARKRDNEVGLGALEVKEPTVMTVYGHRSPEKDAHQITREVRNSERNREIEKERE
ncbi:hypothetical protein CsatB_001027 [Cannabis sativa]